MTSKAKARSSKVTKTAKSRNGIIASGKSNVHIKKGMLVIALGLILVIGAGWLGYSQYQKNSANAASCNVQPFKDVQISDPFCGEIQWLKTKGIVAGYADGTFHPSEAISREEMALVAYYYVLLNKVTIPATASVQIPAKPASCTASPYTDVPVASPFCGAIAWMKANGITTGFGDNTYHPNEDLNRDAAAAFLYRIARLKDQTMPVKPTCTAQPFNDVPTNDMFCGEIQWVKTQGITKGYSDGTYHPVNSISHEAIAAFLYRATNNPGPLPPNPNPGPTPDPGNPNPGPTPDPGNPNPGTPPTPGPTASKATKLLIIMDENTSPQYVKKSMPYAVSLGKKYAEATNVYALSRPSNPNYLTLASGQSVSNVGATNDPPSSKSVKGQSVFGQAIKNGKTAKVYAEGMTSNCQATNVGKYAVKHNPWPYFTDERADCQKYSVSMASFDSDVKSGNLPNAGFIAPDMCNDGHDCKPEDGSGIPDAWLKGQMEKIFAGPDWQSGKLIVIFTFDEPTSTPGTSDTITGTPVYTAVMHKSLEGKNKVVNSRFNHYSFTRLYAEVTGTTPLGNGANAASLRDAFGLPL